MDTSFDIDTSRMQGIMGERQRIRELLRDDEVLHNIWWRIKREDTFPSQDFIAHVVLTEINLREEQDVRSNTN